MLAVHQGQTRFVDAAQILEAPLRGLSTRCEQRPIKRRGYWSRFVGIPQGLLPFPLLTKFIAYRPIDDDLGMVLVTLHY